MLGFHLSKVTGVSMSPQVPDNSYILVVPWLRIRSLKKGQLLSINHPKYGNIIKSLVKIDKNGLIWLMGLHPSSVPIEALGPVSPSQVVGKVCLIFPPKNTVSQA